VTLKKKFTSIVVVDLLEFPMSEHYMYHQEYLIKLEICIRRVSLAHEHSVGVVW